MPKTSTYEALTSSPVLLVWARTFDLDLFRDFDIDTIPSPGKERTGTNCQNMISMKIATKGSTLYIMLCKKLLSVRNVTIF